ncbi:MAG TPA: sulfotransferase, partial [Steroidobacteraceae bacterium]
LRAMAHSLGHARSGEQAFYLKTDCWHIHEIDLIRDAFPQAPWIFLYRDPVDVMVSHQRVPAAWTVPQLLNPRALKLEADDWDPRQTEVYCARALALMCEAALKAARGDERALLLNYSELPHATCDRVLAHFGLPAAGILEMQARAGQDAKAPQSRFAPDHESKQAAATQRLRNTVTLHLADVYRRLEQARLAQSTAPSAGIPEPNIRSEQASVNCERVTHLTSVECKLATRVRRLTLEGEIISD